MAVELTPEIVSARLAALRALTHGPTFEELAARRLDELRGLYDLWLYFECQRRAGRLKLTKSGGDAEGVAERR